MSAGDREQEATARLYLDNAATSYPKPECVYAAMDDYNRRIGVAAGRSASRRGGEVAAIIDRARRAVARILDAGAPEQIVFTLNGTDGLNLVLRGLLRPGDHVVTTRLEHNSVVRPLTALAKTGVRVTTVPSSADGRVSAAEFAAALEPGTRLAVCIHASNVTGVIQPVDEIAAACRAAGVPMLLDAAQTVGSHPFSVRDLGVDFVAAPGHKGLLGPLGTGIVWIRPGWEGRIEPLRTGGTGSRSEESAQPESMPDKFESGNPNVPGLAGLAAGAEWLLEQGVARLAEQERELTRILLRGLKAIPGVSIAGSDDASRVGIVSFQVEGYDPADVAAILEESFGIECRAGLHCAAAAHAELETLSAGGTVRFSVGPFIRTTDVDRAVAAVRSIAEAV